MFKTYFLRSRSRRFPVLAPLLAIALAVLLVVPAFAQTITNTRDPFGFPGSNPCTGEPVLVTGTIHDTFAVTLDGNGGFHLVGHEDSQATGTGDQGNRYVINDAFNFENIGTVGFVDTVTDNFEMISQGSAPNFMVHTDFHFTVNPDGTLTSFHDNIRLECQA